MKKQHRIHNLIIIFATICSALVFTGVESFATLPASPAASVPATASAPASASPNAQISPIQKQKSDVKLPSKPRYNHYSGEETGKTGFKYAIFKFLMAMLGVLISSLAIYGGLKLYKKLVLKNDAKLNNIDYDKTLESPKDFKEAINLFLHKTNKR